MQIIETGKYLTRHGRVVEVREILPKGDYPIKGDVDGLFRSWTRDGRFLMDVHQDIDLVAKVQDVIQDQDPAEDQDLTRIRWDLIIITALGTTIAYWAGRLSCLG